MAQFQHLKVKEVIQNTPNSVTIALDIPENIKAEFAFEAGQYITIKKVLNGEELRRAYSICSSPSSGDLKIGIKKVADGTFSIYANTDIKKDDLLEVHPPEGKFIFNTDAKQNVLAIAAGSGITPIMSIVKTALELNTNNQVVLLYGNKSVSETMFHKEILSLKQLYKERLFIQNIYSQEQNKDALFGRIDTSTLNYVLKNKCAEVSFDSFYLCGPGEMIQEATKTLKAHGIDENTIKYELFTADENNDTTAETVAEGKVQIKVVVDGDEVDFVADKSKRILDAVLEQKIDAPYSCQGGICSSCIAMVTEGKAEMASNQILTDKEVAEGLILTCQAHAVTDTIHIDYDDA